MIATLLFEGLAGVGSKGMPPPDSPVHKSAQLHSENENSRGQQEHMVWEPVSTEASVALDSDPPRESL